jgi:O-antigen biosynthesis protein
MSVTVAIATCGRPDGLARCLTALARQTRRPDALIVVDQGASEQARSAVAGCGLPARYLEQPRLGLSASRNLALKETRTELLAVTDDDCAPDVGWLAAVTEAFARPPAPDAVTGAVLPLGPKPPWGYAVSLRTSETLMDFVGDVLPWNVGTGANFAAPVAVLRRLGGWDPRLGTGSPGRAGEDAELLLRLLADGATVRYEPSAVVCHEWQTRQRRLATRFPYGHGIGALSGLWLRRGPFMALRMLSAYARMQARPLLGAMSRRDRAVAGEHARALAGLVAGLAYGVRVSDRERP